MGPTRYNSRARLIASFIVSLNNFVDFFKVGKTAFRFYLLLPVNVDTDDRNTYPIPRNWRKHSIYKQFPSFMHIVGNYWITREVAQFRWKIFWRNEFRNSGMDQCTNNLIMWFIYRGIRCWQSEIIYVREKSSSYWNRLQVPFDALILIYSLAKGRSLE